MEPSFISLSSSKGSSLSSRERSISSPPTNTVENTTRDKARSSSGADVFTFKEQTKRTGLKASDGSSGLVSSGEYRSGSGLGSPALGAVDGSRDSLHNSLSPHRSLSQAEAAVSDHLKTSVPFEGRDLGGHEDDLVRRSSKKPKSKKKKDKKKKRRESDELTQSLPVEGVSVGGDKEVSGLNKAEAELRKLGLRELQDGVESDAARLMESWRRQDKLNSLDSKSKEDKEELETEVAKVRKDSRRKSVEEVTSSTTENEGEQEMWRPAPEVIAEEEQNRHRTDLETLMETSPSRVLHNKRLSLGDELELAMGGEGKPEVLPDEESHDSHMTSDQSQFKQSVSDGGAVLPSLEEVENRTDEVKEGEEEEEKRNEEKFEEVEEEEVSESPYLGVEEPEQTDGGDVTTEDQLAAGKQGSQYVNEVCISVFLQNMHFV